MSVDLSFTVSSFLYFSRDRRGCDHSYDRWIYNYLGNQCLSPLTV